MIMYCQTVNWKSRKATSAKQIRSLLHDLEQHQTKNSALEDQVSIQIKTECSDNTYIAELQDRLVAAREEELRKHEEKLRLIKETHNLRSTMGSLTILDRYDYVIPEGGNVEPVFSQFLA
ncbi:hypothetical protein PG993_002385 [Apiospora rasikravindrae]|uniref:Uncharacterized protein n=1 Tax=Apiospora rasikravindrae TaxID=990691 RepID=A0ABR1TWG3_9PEZI